MPLREEIRAATASSTDDGQLDDAGGRVIADGSERTVETLRELFAALGAMGCGEDEILVMEAARTIGPGSLFALLMVRSLLRWHSTFCPEARTQVTAPADALSGTSLSR